MGKINKNDNYLDLGEWVRDGRVVRNNNYCYTQLSNFDSFRRERVYIRAAMNARRWTWWRQWWWYLIDGLLSFNGTWRQWIYYRRRSKGFVVYPKWREVYNIFPSTLFLDGKIVVPRPLFNNNKSHVCTAPRRSEGQLPRSGLKCF